MVTNTNESHWFHPSACEHRWLGNIHGHKRLSELRVHKGGLGGMFFSHFYQGLVQSLLNWTKRFLKAFLSRAPQRFVLWVSLHGQMVRACPGLTGCALGVPPSLRAHGDTHPAACLCSYCRRGNKEYLTKAKDLGKEKKIWWIWHSTGPLWAQGGHPSRHRELASCLILFLPVWSLWIYSSKSTSSIMPMIL